MRVLHLEDSPLDHALAARALRMAHPQAEILRVESIEELLRELSDSAFDIILADYSLPGFTALDAWTATACISSPPPFVLLSGAIGEQAAVQAIQQGISDYVSKHDMHTLARVIERAIRQHQQTKEKKAADQALERSQAELRALTEHLHTAIEQERLTIAREIHDDISGALTAIKLDLHWLERNRGHSATTDHIHNALESVQLALEASRRLMANLRPPILEGGLPGALSWLAERFKRQTGITVEARMHGPLLTLNEDILITAFRTAQEALTNIAKHAHCSHVQLDANCSHEFLTLEISDDGRGCDPDDLAKPASFGLRGLGERARSVGGWLDVGRGNQGHGTAVTLTVPLTFSSQVAEPT